jgi:membrane fusion protein, heavy metal efflux system
VKGMLSATAVGIGVVLAFAIACRRGGDPPRSKPPEAVRVASPGTLAVAVDSVFGKRLDVVTLATETVSIPTFNVTGSVAAQLRPGQGGREDRWQFATPDVQSAWADWRRTRGEIGFDERQLQASRELAESRVKAQTAAVERLRKLVEVGTDSQKDLALEEANLAQARLEGQKEVFAAQSALASATRAAAGLERQLLQAGVDPKLLARAPEGAVIVAAEVPEARVADVRAGEACLARFYGLPEATFRGKVRSLGPAVSRERRTLPVLFELSDEQGRLRPGMFADVGLGAEERQALLLPADSVLHVGRADYVLVGIEPGLFRVTPVRVGESYEGRLQVAEGVKAGDRVVGAAAILLKPYVASALSR